MGPILGLTGPKPLIATYTIRQDNDKMRVEVKQLMKQIQDLTRTAGAADHTHHILRNKVVDFTQVSQHFKVMCSSLMIIMVICYNIHL